jgi:hypothetical protein
MQLVQTEYITNHLAVGIRCLPGVFIEVNVALTELRGQVFSSEKNVHPFIDAVGCYQVGDVTGARLRNTMDGVLRLQVVLEAERAVIEDGVIRHCQRQAFLRCSGVATRTLQLLSSLKFLMPVSRSRKLRFQWPERRQNRPVRARSNQHCP